MSQIKLGQQENIYLSLLLIYKLLIDTDFRYNDLNRLAQITPKPDTSMPQRVSKRYHRLLIPDILEY